VSRFNTRGHKVQPSVARATSPIATVSATADTRTFEGAPGWSRTAQAELFLRATGAFHGGVDTFYESGMERDDRLRELTRRIAREDPQWGLEFARWARTEGNIRTGALMFAAEFVHERLVFLREQGPGYVDPHDGINRTIIRVVCRRADEPAEMLAIWTAWFGKHVPKPVKRGIADAVRRNYNGKSLLKYDTASKGYRFGDILNIVHAKPDPNKPWQGDLFQYALDRRHHPDTAVVPASNRTLVERDKLMAIPVGERRAVVTAFGGADRLAEAGMTWEALAGWIQGPMDKEAWEAIIPSMGIMAQLRNLRNFDQAGVSDEAARQIMADLANPEVIAKSQQFPFRFLSAYRATKEAGSLRWAYPLEQALNHSLSNVPPLAGRTLVLVDRSPSMFPKHCPYTPSDTDKRLGMSRADQAALFGCALALRAEDATLVEFGGTSQVVTVPKGSSVLPLVEKFSVIAATDIAGALRKHFDGHNQVVIITDEQTKPGHVASMYEQWGRYYLKEVSLKDLVPVHTPVFMWNLAGYTASAAPSGSDCWFSFGGLTDQAFKMIPLLLAGSRSVWPWQVSQGA
jgi:hypothetical protein